MFFLELEILSHFMSLCMSRASPHMIAIFYQESCESTLIGIFYQFSIS